MSNCVLLLTNHGNEPYLLGVKVAISCGADLICVPHYYFGRNKEPDQEKILKEEFPLDYHKIFLSKQLGRILKPLIRDSKDFRSYSNYVNEFFGSKQNLLGGINKIEQEFINILNNGIEAESLSKKRIQARIYQSDLSFVLNIGLPIKSFKTPTFYLFSALMSAIYKTPLNSEKNEEILEFAPIAEYWEKLESDFTKIFIPKINALTHTGFFSEKITYTPPLSNELKNHESSLTRDSILLIPSGTGFDQAILNKMVSKLKRNYQVVTYSKKIYGTKKVLPNIFADKRLIAVISRGGWGITWRCLIHSKPIGYLNTEYNEDPEIAHSLYTLNYLGIGFSINPTKQEIILPKKEELEKIRTNTLKLLLKDEKDFIINGINYSKNGIGYVVSKISSFLSNSENTNDY